MTRIMLLVAMLCLSACQQSGSSNAIAPRQGPANWQTLGDGSKVAVEDNDSGDLRHLLITRCWGAGPYDCMVAAGNHIPGHAVDWHITVWRESRSELREALPADDRRTGGYACEILVSPMGGMTETISSDAELNKNVVVNLDPQPRPWTRQYVERFMRDNNVTPNHPWFNCTAVWRLIKTAPRSIGTTALTREMFTSGSGSIGDMTSRME